MNQDPDMPSLTSPETTQEQRNTTNIVVVYHANCMDGWLCAILARIEFDGQPILFEARTYEQPFDPEALPLYAKKDVYVLDFSFPPQQLEILARAAKSITVLDHHKTFAESCGRDPKLAFSEVKGNLHVIYSPPECGAEMAYEFFTRKPGSKVSKNVPREITHYVGDRDLWKWDLNKSHEFNEYLASIPKRFNAWLGLLAGFDGPRFNQCVETGAVLLEVKRQDVERLANSYFVAEVAGHKNIPIVNTQSHQSEVGHRMLELCPEAPFVAMYYDVTAVMRKWSLRGRTGDTFDCSAVAKQFGGGGHAKACGFKTSPENDPIVGAFIKKFSNPASQDCQP